MTISETELEEESDGEPNGETNRVAGGGEEESQGAGRKTDERSPRLTTGHEHGGNKVASLNLEGHSLVLL